jgi:hypothetical protein
VVIPPFEIRISARRLEARPVADLCKQLADLVVTQSGSFGVRMKQGESPHGLSQMPLFAYPACFTVVGGDFETAFYGHSYRRRLTVVNNRCEFEIKRELGWVKFEDLKIIAERGLAQVNGSEHQFAVNNVSKMTGLSRGMLGHKDGEVERVHDPVEAIGCGQVDGYAGVKQDLAALHASPGGFG